MKRLTSILASIAIALAASAQWALPHISVAHVRTAPRHSAEMSTQVLMGMPLKVLGKSDGWAEVEMPDGYKGYVITNSLTMLSDSAFDAWRHSRRVIVPAPHEVRAWSSAERRQVATDLVSGDILAASGRGAGGMAETRLPDGRTAWVDSCFVEPLDSWAARTPSVEGAIAMASAQTGSPYLWGGLSVKGMDCSGLTKLSLFSQGVILQRDASQQACTGRPVEKADLRRGDLLFFGNVATGRVTHVGIYLGDDRFIESSGRVRTSVLSRRKDYLSARRVLGISPSESEGIVPVSKHSWYF